ncbi:MAG: hypothetical protein RSA09_00045 [Acinetobacter sp.]
MTEELKQGDKVVFTSKYSKSSVVFTLDGDKSGRMGMRKATEKEIKQGYRDE